jgi:phosphatidylglycerol:prolipoprotein diacylglycerol transferase
MRPVLFEVPFIGVKVVGFGAMMVVALFASIAVAVWRARREKLDPEVFFDLGFWMIVGGVIGARLFFVVQHREAVRSFTDVFKIWQGGIVLYGSIMGGAAAFLIYRAYRPFPFRPAIDVVAPAVILGVAIGRVGCFLNGCCYGDVCNLPWAVRFPAETLPWAHQVATGLIPRSAPASLPIHPTQLYSVADGLIVFGLLSAYYPLRRRDGEVMALLAVTYPVTRFLIETLRDDEKSFFAGLTVSQNISILIFLGGLAFWYYLTRLPVGRYTDTADPPPGPVSTMAASGRALDQDP